MKDFRPPQRVKLNSLNFSHSLSSLVVITMDVIFFWGQKQDFGGANAPFRVTVYIHPVSNTGDASLAFTSVHLHPLRLCGRTFQKSVSLIQ